MICDQCGRHTNTLYIYDDCNAYICTNCFLDYGSFYKPEIRKRTNLYRYEDLGFNKLIFYYDIAIGV